MIQPLTQNVSAAGPCTWSVDEFYGLVEQQLVSADAPIELVDGEVCQLPVCEQLDRHISLLTYQIRRALAQLGCEGLSVQSHQPIKLNDCCELKPAIAVIKSPTTRSHVIDCAHSNSSSSLRWVLDIADEGLNQRGTRRSQLFAQSAVCDYWSVTVSQAELRTYQGPTAAGYQRCELRQVGEPVTPASLPQISLCMQEPLPLYFLTRSLKGQRTYTTAAPPLQVCSLSRRVS